MAAQVALQQIKVQTPTSTTRQNKDLLLVSSKGLLLLRPYTQVPLEFGYRPCRTHYEREVRAHSSGKKSRWFSITVPILMFAEIF